MTDVSNLLANILFQMNTIQRLGHKPAIIKMHAITSEAINEYMKPIMVKDSSNKGRHELYGLQVVVDPCMNPGTARVFMEWE